VSDINIPEFYRRVYRELHDVKLVLIKNPDIAQQLRQQIMKHFDFDKFAFFDINGTLVDSFLVRIFAEYLTFNGKFEKEKWHEIQMTRAAEKKGAIAHDRYIAKTLELYAKGLKGRTVEEIRALAHNFVEEGRIPLFGTSRRLFNWVGSHYRTVAVTKTTEEIMEALHGVFAFDDVICSQLEVKDGKYTGKIKRTLVSKADKTKAFKGWLKKTQPKLDGSIGFGNLSHDFCFLEQVTTPVLLGNSDKQSIRVAKRRGWLVFSEADGANDVIGALKKRRNG
jgi:HAD superfamily phosphoserine phosphatase-like hydrolase